MKNKNFIKNLEIGQVIPMVILMLFVIIGMVALIVDGGAVMSNRREAQAAADSGALAGAQRACMGYGDAIPVAESYALTNNATSATATVLGYEVSVQATVEYESFFAKIFGDQTLKASAEATAGCYGVRGASPLPLAWNCLAKSVGGGPFDPAYGCQIQSLSWNLLGPMADPNWTPASERTTSISINDYDGNARTYHMSGTNILDNLGVPPEQIYIIIDSDKICKEDDPLIGTVVCDLDGDGKKDIVTGGNRGWLYLSADTSDIAQWLGNPGPPLTLTPHTWLSGKSGVVTSVYIKLQLIAYGYQGRVVLIPVYNTLCDGDPRTDTACVSAAHAFPWPPAPPGGDNFSEIRNKTFNYHILTFAPFYISCISTKGACPGYQLAMSLNGVELKEEPIIEGFFLHDVDVSPDVNQGCDINLGNCVISLSN